jgi:hypothetical protein
MVEAGYQKGVPMGGELPERSGNEVPTFVVSALQDPGTDSEPGVPLDRIQIVKGSVGPGPGGEADVEVYDVAGGASEASLDPEACEQSGTGASSLCAVWTDPDFDPDAAAYYYARVLQVPTCRWHTRLCNSLPEDERDDQCDNPDVQTTIRERAWTSPIWYRADG